MKTSKHPYDFVMLSALISLAILGLLIVASSSYILAAENFGDRYHYLKLHSMHLMLAAFAFVIASHVKLQAIRVMAIPLLILSTALLAMLLVKSIGTTAGGATRWLRFGGFSFQPSELAKLAAIVTIAHYASRKGSKLRKFSSGYLPILVCVGLPASLILLQPDFGSTAALLMIALVMLYIAGAQLKHIAATCLLAVPAVIYLIFSASYRKQRLLAFIDPWKDPMDTGFQIIQSYVAFGNGGIFGQGLGDGLQKIFYLPEVHTDFVFSVIGEEIGFVGVFLTISLFVILVGRIFMIALQSRDTYSMLLAAGIALLIGLQAATNMAVVMGLLPTKGLTLPFVSYGGSSLLMSAAGAGLAMNVARHAPKERRKLWR